MKLTKFFAFALAALAFVGCGNDETTTPNDDPTLNPTGGITLKADKTAITIGETVTFTVVDSEGQDVTANANIYDSDLMVLESNEYKFTDSEISNTITIVVLAEMPDAPVDMEPENFKFNHRAVMVDHTAMNCGYCPWMTDYLLEYAKTANHSHYNEVTCHAGYLANGDPAASTAATTLMNYHGKYFSFGNPTLIFNFKTGMVGNQSVYANVKKDIDKVLGGYIKEDGAHVGISMTVDGDYYVNAWLLESDIYSPNQAYATKDEHMWYHFALRNFSEETNSNNIAGLSIGEHKAGTSYVYGGELEIINPSWNWENMGVLVVVSAANSNGSVEVVNSAYCPVGEQLPFEYL